MILKYIVMIHMIKSSYVLTVLHGLLPALKELLPNVDQRFCVRYHYLNMFTM